jgi:hypothetical protein
MRQASWPVRQEGEVVPDHCGSNDDDCKRGEEGTMKVSERVTKAERNGATVLVHKFLPP